MQRWNHRKPNPGSTTFVTFREGKTKPSLSGRFLDAHKAYCQCNTSRSGLPGDAPTKYSVRNHRGNNAGLSPAAPLQLGAGLAVIAVEVAHPYRAPTSGHLFHQCPAAAWLPGPPGGLPGAHRSGRAGQPRALSAGYSEAATPVWCSRLGYSYRAKLAPEPFLGSWGAASWLQTPVVPQLSLLGDPTRRAQQQFRLRRPAETAGAVHRAGPRCGCAD